jgi:hypothetical protein
MHRRKMKIIATIVGIFLHAVPMVCFCYGGADSPGSVAGTVAPQSGANWAILEQAPFASPIWRPEPSVIPPLIDRARTYVENLKNQATVEYKKKNLEYVLSHWDHYACQIVGYTEKGKKLVHLNFFPLGRENENWRRDYLHAYDGGASFWRLDYDPEKQACLNFDVNGPA